MGPHGMLQLKHKHVFQILIKRAAPASARDLPRAGDPENEVGARPSTLAASTEKSYCKRDVISHTASADDLYVCKVTFTMLKTVFAGYKQLLTFLHLL